MRVTAGEHWAELRDVGDMTWADQEAWDAVWNDAIFDAQREQYDPETGERRMIMSADGVSMVPVKVVPKITSAMAITRTDNLLASLITEWSLTGLELPYRPGYKRQVPLAFGKELDKALAPYIEVLTDAGPKETEPSSASGSSSKARPRTSPKG